MSKLTNLNGTRKMYNLSNKMAPAATISTPGGVMEQLIINERKEFFRWTKINTKKMQEYVLSGCDVEKIWKKYPKCYNQELEREVERLQGIRTKIVDEVKQQCINAIINKEVIEDEMVVMEFWRSKSEQQKL